MMAPFSPFSSPARLVSGILLALPWVSIASALSAADYYVRKLPGAPSSPEIKMHAGHIEVDPEHNGNLFFWHFQGQQIVDKQRTVIWLNGGPGCSSEDGALMEIGPYRVSGDNLVYNNGSWNQFANLLFVDNPVGTGYSYVDTNSYLRELDEMAEQFIIFLEQFFQLFPQYQSDELYIAGESYAGQYIPYIAKHILERNKQYQPDQQWNLKELVIGNGWISPMEQYDSYLKYAYERSIIQRGSPNAKQLEQMWRICRNNLAVEVKVHMPGCEQILSKLLEMTSAINLDGKRECYNMYDIRLKDTYPSCGMNWPPDLKDMAPYLRKKEVTEALNINPGKTTGWTECNGAVGASFRARDSEPSRQLLPALLEEVPITLFAGAEDLICNHIGIEDLIKKMEWNGAVGFQSAPRLNWTFNDEDAGYWQSARNLTYILFNEASHMVPFDWPLRSRDMLDRVMKVDSRAVGDLQFVSHIDGDEDSPASEGSGTDSGTKSGAESDAATDEETQKQIDEAKWKAYYRSGEIVLVIVVIAAAAWGWYIWRQRRKRKGYQGLAGGEGGGRSTRSRSRAADRLLDRRGDLDIEAGEFDERRLDDLHVTTPMDGPDQDAYAVGGDSDEDDDDDTKREEKEKERTPESASGSGSPNRS